ncbi:MAG: hypothetical protein KC561_21330, partial [Myxococcales bacterium]|nr:hypothetical protein [Myxococcales bacterium]
LSGGAVNVNGWQLCTTRETCRTLPDVTVPDRGETVIHLEASENESNELEIYFSEALEIGPAGELALYSSTENWDSIDALKIYFLWGATPADPQFLSTAIMSMLWSEGEVVELCEGHVGFVAVGDTRHARGWKSQANRCFF